MNKIADTMEMILHRLWRALPDNCEADYCEKQGVRGNENRHPVVYGGSGDGYIVLCDQCSSRYCREGQLMVNGICREKMIEERHVA